MRVTHALNPFILIFICCDSRSISPDKTVAVTQSMTTTHLPVRMSRSTLHCIFSLRDDTDGTKRNGAKHLNHVRSAPLPPEKCMIWVKSYIFCCMITETLVEYQFSPTVLIINIPLTHKKGLSTGGFYWKKKKQHTTSCFYDCVKTCRCKTFGKHTFYHIS